MQQHSSGVDGDKFFSVRIVSLDYYHAPPVPGLDVTFSSLEGTAVDSVPVVRVFGSTPAGQRVCLHLHQVLQMSLIVYASCSFLQARLGLVSAHHATAAAPQGNLSAEGPQHHTPSAVSQPQLTSSCSSTDLINDNRAWLLQVFPYFYVPYGNDLPSEPSEGEEGFMGIRVPASQGRSS